MIKSHGNRLICRIDVFSLLGVQIVLFVIFTCTIPAYPHHGIYLDLPKARYSVPMPRALREDAMIVTVMSDGKIVFDAQLMYFPGGLRQKLQERVRSGSERRVYIKADGGVRYRAVKDVLEQARLAGIQKIGILTERGRLQDGGR